MEYDKILSCLDNLHSSALEVLAIVRLDPLKEKEKKQRLTDILSPSRFGDK